MKTRLLKLHGMWVVEFPFMVVVYCDTWDQAVGVLYEWDKFLLTTERA